MAFCWRVAVGAASKLTLAHFCRSVNKIGDDGAKALAVALQSNSSLTRLDLSGNQHAASASFRCDDECFTFVGCSNSTWRRRPCGVGRRAEAQPVGGAHRVDQCGAARRERVRLLQLSFLCRQQRWPGRRQSAVGCAAAPHGAGECRLERQARRLAAVLRPRRNTDRGP